MSYFFPHQTREVRRLKTVDDFERHYQVIKDIEESKITEIVESIPLWEDLFHIPIKKKKDDWQFDQWRDVYVKHGWNEVKGEPRLKSDVKIIKTDKGKIGIKENFVHDERSDKWTEFTKEIDGVSYKRSFPDDKQMFWSCHTATKTKDSYRKRKQLIRDSSYDLDCLEYFTTIYLHEAFLIMLGVSIDKMERGEFNSWGIGGVLLDKRYELPDWFKKNFHDFKEWKILKRRFGNGEKVASVSLEHGKVKFDTIGIDTQEFIEWALKIGIIEQDTAHFRDGRKAPYDESFSKMLHEELLVNDLIKQGKHHHEWTWNKKTTNGANSFNYLGKLLALNRVPIKYWLPYDKHSVSWKDLQHYIVGVKTPQNHSTEPKNMRTIENIVKKLLEEHDKRPIEEYKDL
ncbi:hypothetical protein N9D42_01925 [Candidatus Thioglobus sp.]|nr:hypothetical protein [Candidatus Thioglobus sp.]